MMLRPALPLVVLAGFVLVLLVAGLVHGWRAKGRPARIAGWLRVLLALLVLGIALRPVQGHLEPRPAEPRVDVLIMIDRTTSMGATDYAAGAPRMSGVAADVAELMHQIAGARVGVIVIDDEARLAVPFTTDAQAVSGFVATAGWRNARTAAGSDISVGVELAQQTLERAAAERPEHQRYFFYFGDGEQTVDIPPRSFAELAGLLAGSLVLGYGTAAGAAMLLGPDTDELVSIDGVPQLSHLGEPNLTAIAGQLGGRYLHRAGPGGLPEVVPPEARTADEFVTTVEYYWMLALAGVPLLLVLLGRAVVGVRTARAELTTDREPISRRRGRGHG